MPASVSPFLCGASLFALQKKKGGVPDAAPQKTTSSSSASRGTRPASAGKEENAEELDPIVLRSRQLAIRGNEMANQGEYSAAIDLFTTDGGSTWYAEEMGRVQTLRGEIPNNDVLFNTVTPI